MGNINYKMIARHDPHNQPLTVTLIEDRTKNMLEPQIHKNNHRNITIISIVNMIRRLRRMIRCKRRLNS